MDVCNYSILNAILTVRADCLLCASLLNFYPGMEMDLFWVIHFSCTSGQQRLLV